MVNDLKLMCVLAHPDDESLGTGGILAKYAAEGVETYLVTATRGERGWFGNESDYPGLEALGKRREAASPDDAPCHRSLPPHRVSKLYYMVAPEQLLQAYQSAFGDVVMHIDGVERRAAAWPEWAITTRIAIREYRQAVWQAILCHESRLMVYRQLEHVSQEHQQELWESQTYYRAFSLVNGGRGVEDDLFAGLR